MDKTLSLASTLPRAADALDAAWITRLPVSDLLGPAATISAIEPIWQHHAVSTREGPFGVLDSLAATMQSRRGQQIYKEDSPVEHCYRIVRGVARRLSTRADGRRQTVDLLRSRARQAPSTGAYPGKASEPISLVTLLQVAAVCAFPGRGAHHSTVAPVGTGKNRLAPGGRWI